MSGKTNYSRDAFRKLRTRSKIKGFTERARLSVFRSSKHIYAQVIDDAAGKTLATASTLEMDKRAKLETSKEVGRRIAEKAKAVQVEKVVFDRGALPYHGQVKALAEGAREGGLKF
jgi:large subunit ribosomal protein L18